MTCKRWQQNVCVAHRLIIVETPWRVFLERRKFLREIRLSKFLIFLVAFPEKCYKTQNKVFREITHYFRRKMMSYQILCSQAGNNSSSFSQ